MLLNTIIGLSALYLFCFVLAVVFVYGFIAICEYLDNR